MIKINKLGIVLEKTEADFENDSVLNPAVIMDGAVIHMLYRAVNKEKISTIGYCKLSSPLIISERCNKPLSIQQFDYASMGIEDPRIVKIEDTYFITYTSYDGINALGTLVTTLDFKTFVHHGIIVPKISFDDFKKMTKCNSTINVKYFRHNRHFERKKKIYLWDKDVTFFPRRINGKLAFLHRIRPGIQLVLINELNELTDEFWNQYFKDFNNHIVLDPVGINHESGYIGSGAPPIETEIGWLLIYHGVYDTSLGYIYSAAAALLDLDDPTKVIARLIDPIFKPELDYEINGVVNNVVFPTGTAIIHDKLYIYYGAADKCIACASLSLKELLKELLLNKIDYES